LLGNWSEWSGSAVKPIIDTIKANGYLSTEHF
jgi:hypothetical protein